MATKAGNGSDGGDERPEIPSDDGANPVDEQPTIVTPIPAPSDDVLPEFTTRAQRRQAGEGPDARPLGTPSPLGRLLLPLAIIVLCIIALLAAWKHLGDKQGARAAHAANAAASATARSTATPSPHATPTPTPTHASPSTSPSPSASGHATASSSPSPPASATPSTTATAAAHTADRSVHVIVLNATGRTGLAARVAAKLQAKGWVITRIGNWTHGGITRTSIYVDGHADAAATLRADFPYATGPLKKPWSQMSQSRITIVLGSDYPR